ncbi:MAG TPA: oligosaccharide flippase family protein [Candidatus Dormibacteraeota bacterium]|nr:oligosaccharide flippase family protein [Candidatus Dormibacteraeota bacterium]
MVEPEVTAVATAGLSPRGLLRTLRSPGDLMSHVRGDSLLRNSLFIMTTTVVNSGFGFAFWVVAARLFPTEVVGVTAALMAAGTIIALLASLGVGATLIQSLPEQRSSTGWSLTFWAGMVTAVATSLVIGCGVFLVLPLVSGDFSVLHRPAYAAVLAVGTVAMTVNAVLDYSFLAERAAGNMLSRNSAVAVGKLLATLLLTVVAGHNALALLGAWALAAAVGLGLGAGLLIRRVNFLHLPRPSALARRALGLRSRLVGHQLVSMGAALLPYLLPLLVTARLSASDNAYFYTTWMMAGIFLIIAPAVSQSLFAEGAHSPHDVLVKARRALTIIAVLIAPCILVILVMGGVLLSAFGPAYAHHSLGLLHVVVLAAIPDVITNVYVAVLRVQGRLRTAAGLNLGMGVGILALSWMLLPMLGISAVGWAWLAMQLSGCAFVVFDLTHRQPHLIPEEATR